MKVHYWKTAALLAVVALSLVGSSPSCTTAAPSVGEAAARRPRRSSRSTSRNCGSTRTNGPKSSAPAEASLPLG